MSASPYMPDSARAFMPNSALQPLPPYLRKDFAQGIDRTRPHELILPMVGKKKADPIRMGSLQYRYLDTNETVTVPNIWYNQTVEMRMEWWVFELGRREETVAKARKELAAAKACTGPFYLDVRTEKAVENLTWHLQQCEELRDTVQKVHDDVKAGIRFL